jgi:pimeloyl-ACP methyl ester carboxylesterase
MADLDRPTLAVPDAPGSGPGARPAVAAASRHLSAAIRVALLGVTICQEHAGAQPTRELPTGTIIPIVVTRAEPDQTYALYLPSSYDARRTWPVIYAFDPSARGQLPLECFRKSAEKYGYIVVGSNISRNGPLSASLRAGLAMMRDVLDRLSVDERRLYAAGFSGGARVATMMAQAQKGRIAGVIGCAAGFPEAEGPTAQTPFAFCGTVGNEDYNWLEMNRIDRTLASLDRPHRLLRFSGGHSWPPKDVAMAAVEWLELQAMKGGTRPKDAALIDGWLQRDLSRARDQENRGTLYEAWLTYSDLATTFRGLIDVQPFVARAAALQNQDVVKKEIRGEREAEDLEVTRRIEISRYVTQMSDTDQQAEAARSLYALINGLKRKEQSARTPSERLLTRRLIEHASITAYYAGQALFDSGEYHSALSYVKIQAAIHPESSAIQYRLAVTYGRAGDRKNALEALKSAADNGFSDVARIEQERGFEKLRDDPRCRQILALVRANKKSP